MKTFSSPLIVHPFLWPCEGVLTVVVPGFFVLMRTLSVPAEERLFVPRSRCTLRPGCLGTVVALAPNQDLRARCGCYPVVQRWRMLARLAIARARPILK